MMKNIEFGYKKRLKKDGWIEYDIKWSPYILTVNKFDVLKKLSEMTGIYAVFYLNEYKRLSILMLGASWYTGLRTSMLRLYDTNPYNIIPKEVLLKIESEKIYFKFIEIYDLDDFLKIFYKLKTKYQHAFIDANGLEVPDDIGRITLLDKNTKVYHKNTF